MDFVKKKKRGLRVLAFELFSREVDVLEQNRGWPNGKICPLHHGMIYLLFPLHALQLCSIRCLNVGMWRWLYWKHEVCLCRWPLLVWASDKKDFEGTFVENEKERKKGPQQTNKSPIPIFFFFYYYSLLLCSFEEVTWLQASFGVRMGLE